MRPGLYASVVLPLGQTSFSLKTKPTPNISLALFPKMGLGYWRKESIFASTKLSLYTVNISFNHLTTQTIFFPEDGERLEAGFGPTYSTHSGEKRATETNPSQNVQSFHVGNSFLLMARGSIFP